MKKVKLNPSEAAAEAKKKDMELFIKRYNRFFQKTLIAMLAGLVPRRYIPDLILNTGTDCFTDNERIVLGLDQEDCKSEQDLYAFVYYVLGHEVQHILSTTQKPWVYGITTGIKHVVAAFQKFYGYPQSTLLGEANIRAVIKKIQSDGHLIPPYEQIANWCHYICNAVEDGRIERHRTGMYPGYGRYVRLFRGRMWSRLMIEPTKTAMNATEEMSVYCNSILSLATCHVYCQGFWKTYAGTHIADTVDEIRKHITKAVYSRKCKQCMNECVSIIDILIPTFIESYVSNPMNAFMQMLSQLMEQIMNAHGAEGFSERKEASEEEATGNGSNPLGQSVLGKPETNEDGEVTGNVTEDGGNGEDGNQPSGGDMNTNQEGDSGKSGKASRTGNNQSGQGKKTEGDNAGSDMAGTAGGSNSFSASDLKAEMEAAAAQIASDVSASSGNIKTNDASTRPDISDSSSNASAIALKAHIPFEEVQRVYTVDIPLPPIIEEQGRTLRDKVKRIFQTKKTDSFRKKTKGQVDPSRIYTLAMNEGDCFKLRKKPDKFSGCCYILQDNSGSMGGGRNSKRMFASEASARIEYAFKDFMPLKIVAFDEDGKIIHEVIKNWNDNFRESCSYNFFHKGRQGACNCDYHDITIAAEELLSRPEREKILIVISDGLPCTLASSDGSPTKAVANAVEYARSRRIKVVGIYIDDNVKESDRRAYEAMYGTSCVFTDTDHISDELARVMTSWAHI